MFAVMLSALQQSPRVDRMAYQGGMLLFSVYHPLSRESPCYDGFTVRGEMPIFYNPLSRQPPWLDRLAARGATVDCNCCSSAVCLPAGSWGALEMHGLVKTWGAQMLMYFWAGFFRVDSLSIPVAFPRAVQSASVSQSLSVSTRDHSDQAGCSTDWLGKLLLSPFLNYTWPLLHSSTQVYHCHHVIL